MASLAKNKIKDDVNNINNVNKPNSTILKLSARSYKSANARAIEVLLKRNEISFDDMAYVLSALPQPKNTRRISVIPEDHKFVHSQSAGLTTQKGLKPTLSSICLSAPNVVRCLSKFVLDFDPTFRFTTITLNYNYSSAPHRDVNHEGGKARIIALGEFTGGELILNGEKINIRDKWFDFIGTDLHSTAPFEGERYSLVYFIHDVWKVEEAKPIGIKLINLGIPWPGRDIQQQKLTEKMKATIQTANINSNNNAIENNKSNYNNVNNNSTTYFTLSNNKHFHNYKNFVNAEVESFFFDENIILISSNNKYADMKNDDHDTTTTTNTTSNNNNNNNIMGDISCFICHKIITNNETKINDVASQCVSFQIFKEVYSESTIDILAQAYIDKKFNISMDRNYEMDIIAIDTTNDNCNNKLSTRRRRKISNQLGIPRSNFIVNKKNSHERDLILKNKDYYVLLLIYDSNEAVKSVHLIKHIFNHENLFSGNNILNNKMKKSKKKDPPSSVVIQGTTPIKPALARIMCNLGNVTKTSFCLDPFVGSGSLLKHCQGTYNIGVDALSSRLIQVANDDDNNVDIIKKENVLLNYDLCLGNVFHKHFRDGELFDQIICDPPYGRREKHVDEFGKDDTRHDTNQERALAQFEILKPLFHLASKTLCINGKLVFGFFNYPGNEKCYWSVDDLPKHDNLKVENICREEWKYSSGHILARDIVVVKRVSA